MQSEKVPPLMSMNSVLPFMFTLAMAIGFFSCAGQVPPGGGPVDTIPPTITYTEPDTNAINVQTDKIVLQFSEYVERRSVEESIFISPYFGQREFDWSGTTVAITFSEQLKKHTTYVLNVGTDVIDIRARNRMANGFTLAFSTGDSIDKGMIKGKVFDDRAEGVMMFAYGLRGLNPDTLDPSKTKPDYIMQTGKDGSFTFSNIRFDAYRLFAVRDEYRNLVYDKQVDQFGVTTRDISIDATRPLASEVWFRLFAEDTAKPFLTNVIPVSSRQLVLRFSEPVDSASFTKADIAVKDTLTQHTVPILLRSLIPSDSMGATVVMSASLDSGNAYRLSVENVADKAGNRIDSTNASYAFLGVGTPDTLMPRLELVGMRDSVKEIPLDQTFELRFSEPVKQTPLNTAITFSDSAKNRLRRSLRWLTASSVVLAPELPLKSKSWYAIRVVMDSVQDFAGNTYKDSVYITRFQSLDLKTTGTIEGFVVDADTGKNLGDIVLTVMRIASSSPSTKTLRQRQPGSFKFEQLPEGRYTLRAFRDKDSSQTYSYGKPFPFLPSERFAVYPDTLKVRARWGVEGVNMSFKRDK